MMKDSLNKKTYIGDIEPNPKEFGIWVKQDGTAKVYDYINNEWKGGSGSEIDGYLEKDIKYYKFPDDANLDTRRQIAGMVGNTVKYLSVGQSYGYSIEPAIGVAMYALVNKAQIVAFSIITTQLVYETLDLDNEKDVTITTMEERFNMLVENLNVELVSITKEEFYSF